VSINVETTKKHIKSTTVIDVNLLTIFLQARYYNYTYNYYLH